MQDAEILQQIEEKAAGQYFISESDYPFVPVNWGSTEITDEFLKGQSEEKPDSEIEQKSFDEFYAKYAPRENYGVVLDALKNNLTDLRVYRVGRVNIGVYLIGKSPEGNWLGLSTRSVET